MGERPGEGREQRKKKLGLIVFCDKNANGKSFVPFALVSVPFTFAGALVPRIRCMITRVCRRTYWMQAENSCRSRTILFSVRLTLSNRFYYAAHNKNYKCGFVCAATTTQMSSSSSSPDWCGIDKPAIVQSPSYFMIGNEECALATIQINSLN